MKIRIMFKRVVQPPIDTPAMIDYYSEVFEATDVLGRFLEGKDCNGCAIGKDVVGMEIEKER